MNSSSSSIKLFSNQLRFEMYRCCQTFGELAVACEYLYGNISIRFLMVHSLTVLSAQLYLFQRTRNSIITQFNQLKNAARLAIHHFCDRRTSFDSNNEFDNNKHHIPTAESNETAYSDVFAQHNWIQSPFQQCKLIKKLHSTLIRLFNFNPQNISGIRGQ